MLNPDLDTAFPLLEVGRLPFAPWLKKYTGEGSEPAYQRYRSFRELADNETAGDVAGDIAKAFAERGDYSNEVVWRRADVAHQLRSLQRNVAVHGLSVYRKISRQAALTDALASLAISYTNAGTADCAEGERYKNFERAAEAYSFMYDQAGRFVHHPKLPPGEIERLRGDIQKARYGLGVLHRCAGLRLRLPHTRHRLWLPPGCALDPQISRSQGARR